MKNQNKLHTIIKWAEAELGLALAVLVLGTVMIGGTTAYVSPTPMDVGNVEKPIVSSALPQSTKMIINQIPVDGLNFTAKTEKDLYKVTTGWQGHNQDLVTTNQGTRGAQSYKTYTYKTNLDHPYNGTLWLAGSYESAIVNNQFITPKQALVELNDATEINLSFKGGKQNIFATLTEVVGGNHPNFVLATADTKLAVVPDETEVMVDQDIQLRAVEIDKYGRALETYPRWEVEENSKNIVKINNSGTVTGLAPGRGFVFAKVGDNITHVEVNVKNTVQTITEALAESKLLEPINIFTTLFDKVSK